MTSEFSHAVACLLSHTCSSNEILSTSVPKACRRRELSAKQKFTRDRWRKHVPSVCGDVLKVFKTFKACSNEANMLVQHHPTFLDVTCWPRLNTMLDNVERCWLEFKLA